MARNKKEMRWPEHISWWDRNEKKVNIVLWVVFVILLIIARIIFSQEIVDLKVAVIWGVFFILDLTLLSFLSNGVGHRKG